MTKIQRVLDLVKDSPEERYILDIYVKKDLKVVYML